MKFVVVQDSELNTKLGRINRQVFGKARGNNTSSGSIADDDTIQNAFYNAPTVVHLFSTETYPNSIQDCCVAAENMMLEATELGVGSVYIARGEKTFASELGQVCVKKWNLEGYVCHSIVPLGYGTKELLPMPRRQDRVLFD